jgi:alpha-tubulin suppressor-like RCC1 family protein
MSSKRREPFAPVIRLVGHTRNVALAFMSAVALFVAACGGDPTDPDRTELRLSTIVIDSGSREVELDTTFTLTATAKDTAEKVVTVPFVWRSSVDSIVTIGRDGKVIAKDTGTVTVTAAALGITSAAIQIRVVFRGPAKIEAVQFNPPLAISPGAQLTDSIRVLVTDAFGRAATRALVKFEVTEGGGTVSPTFATVAPSGLASTKWTLGGAVGTNKISAIVVRSDSATRNTRVRDNPTTFSVKSYAALTVVNGDAQTGALLSVLPVAPSVRLVDSAGKPRAGVPVSFAASANGRVANTVASTSVDGVASPGVWTLGDVPGDQQLVATVESAKVILRATATGSTVRFPGTQVATTQTATCAASADQLVSCFGAPPMIGTGDTVNVTSPKPTKGDVRFTSIAGGGGGAHFCGITADLSIYCWGINSFVDSSGTNATSNVPTRLQSNIAWLQVSVGGQHNCALANDRSAYCWGIDTSGQLGDNGITRKLTPQPVAGGFKFTSLAAGGSHQCGITTEALAFCWGLNNAGQIGDGTNVLRRSPTAVTGGLKWKAIGAGGAWTCGLTEPGAAQCWGAGTGRASPAPYNTAVTFAALTVGGGHACALTAEGRAYCWGDNSSGQLGDSTTTSRDTPTEVATELRFASLSAGPQHTCGVTIDRLIACWGRNTVGELGLDTPLVQGTPRFVVIGVKP